MDTRKPRAAADNHGFRQPETIDAEQRRKARKAKRKRKR